MAVGSSDFHAVTERWDGAKWRTEPLRSPADILTTVSCTAPSACTAVGALTGGPLGVNAVAQQWNGTTWTRQTIPPTAHVLLVDGVSCTAPNSCVAVGVTSDAKTSSEAFADRYS
jgi:hypothetical protein